MKLSVPGATLHYQLVGDGPLVLMLQGGDGDADASVLIARRLPNHRVLSYDRRGLYRSPVDEAPKSLNLSTHTDDVHALLRAVSDGPAYVFGTSIGALIGLDLLARYPDQVKKLIAHEPPLTGLLDEADRQAADVTRDEIDTLYRTQGVLPAMRKFLAATGVDFFDREPDVGLPLPKPERMQNLKFFLEHDAPAARRFEPDLASLRPFASRIVVAAGEKSKAMWLHRCAAALAQAIDAPLVAFPGGHGGSASHPNGFAEKIRALFGEG